MVRAQDAGRFGPVDAWLEANTSKMGGRAVLNRWMARREGDADEAEAGGVGYGYGEWMMGAAVSSPGLFGSLPWVNNRRGKQERYKELMQLVDAALL
jgi:hypothetical protein